MRLYAPTIARRATVTQEIRVVLEPDPGAPPGSIRRVQIVVPSEPKLYIGFDVDPAKLGPGYVKRLPELAPGQLVKFELQPQQSVVLAADIGMASPSIFVEHVGDP